MSNYMMSSSYQAKDENVYQSLASTWREEIAAKLSETRQQHILGAFDALTTHADRETLHTSLMQSVGDVRHVERIHDTSMATFLKAHSSSNNNNTCGKDEEQEEETIVPPSQQDCVAQFPDALYDDGLRLVAEGACAVVILAGGSGTRLGFEKPKGMFVCPALRHQLSLFEVHALKLRKVEQLASCGGGSEEAPVRRIPLVLMTSDQTDAETRAFFSDNDNFGLKPEQVFFFRQDSVPCFDRDGRILLSTPTSVASAPSGNAGIYASIHAAGVLDTLKQRFGTRYLQIVTVDNLTCKIADPVMFGFAAKEKADVVVKTTPKACDDEKVGVFAKRIDGKSKKSSWGVVEYTELGAEMAKQRDPNTGERAYNCANIAIHLCTMDFMFAAAEAMKTFDHYHVALKPIPVMVRKDGEGPLQEASVPGVKLEAFIFDLFFLAKATAFRIMQVDRVSEFSPVKNADKTTTLPDGTVQLQSDSPATAVRNLRQLHTQWVRDALMKRVDGVDDAAAHQLLEALDNNKGGKGGVGSTVEIHPLVSYNGEGLRPTPPDSSASSSSSLSLIEGLIREASKSNL